MLGEVAEVAEEIIRETCKELDIEIINMAVSVDHVHLFIKYPPKYSVSWTAKRIKGRSSKLLKDQFPRLKEWCPGHLPVGAFLLSWIRGTWLGSGRAVYIGAEGLREDRYRIGDG